MATTPQNVINSALIILGVIFPGQTPSTSMSNDALTRLNEMLASWSSDRLFVYGILRNTYNLTSGTNVYTLGPAGTFSGTRPLSIVRATIITPSLTLRSPLKLATTEEWSEIADQTTSGTVPEILYNDYEYPASNLWFWPTPNSSSTQVELFTWQQLEQFTTLSDSFDLPPGYEQAVIYSLAMQLSSVYGRPMSQENMLNATQSRSVLQGLNAPPTHLSGAGAELIAAGQVAQQAGMPPRPR